MAQCWLPVFEGSSRCRYLNPTTNMIHGRIQMLLGIPLFGYVFKSKRIYLNSGNPMVANQTFDSFASHSFKGAHKDISGQDTKELKSGEPLETWWNKPISFKHLVSSGALVKRFDGNYGQGTGYTLGTYSFLIKRETFANHKKLAWDDASSTPVCYLLYSEFTPYLTSILC